MKAKPRRAIAEHAATLSAQADILLIQLGSVVTELSAMLKDVDDNRDDPDNGP